MAGGLGTIVTTIVGALAIKSPGSKFLPFQKIGEKEADGETKGVYANIFQAKSKKKELAIDQERKSIDQSKKSWDAYIGTMDEVLKRKRLLAKAKRGENPDLQVIAKAEDKYREAKIKSEKARQELVENKNNEAYKGLYSVYGLDKQVDWDDDSKWAIDTSKQNTRIANSTKKLKQDIEADAKAITESREKILNDETAKAKKTSQTRATIGGISERRKALKEIEQHGRELSSQNNVFNKKLETLKETADVIIDLDSGLEEVRKKEKALTHTKGGKKKKLTVKRRAEVDALRVEKEQYEAAKAALQERFNAEREDLQSTLHSMTETANSVSERDIKNHKGEKVDVGEGVKNNINELNQSISNLDTNNVNKLKEGFAEVDTKAKGVSKSIGVVSTATKKITNVAKEVKETMSSAWNSIGDGAKNFIKNIGATFAVDLAIQGVMWLADELIVTSAEKLEKMEAVVNKYNSSMDEINQNTSTIKSLSGEFHSLANGVDASGKNIGLSADQYARYNEIVNELVAINPSLIQGYTAEGQAILDKNTAIAESIRLQEELAGKTTKEYLSDGRSVYDGYIEKFEEQSKKLKELTDTTGNGDINFKTSAMRDKYRDELSKKVTSAADEHGIDSDEYQKAVENLQDYESTLKEVESVQQDMTQYLQTYVSTSEEFGGLGLSDLINEDAEKFKAGFDEISGNTTLSFEEMKSQAGKFVRDFSDILSQDGAQGIADEVRKLEEAKNTLNRSDFSESDIKAYEKTINSQVKSIEELADSYESSAPEIAAALDNIAQSYKNYVQDITVADALKGDAGLLDSARNQLAQHQQVADGNNYTTAIKNYKEIYKSAFEGINEQGTGNQTFWDAAERMLGQNTLKKLDYDIEKVKKKLKSLNSSEIFDEGWGSTRGLRDKLKEHTEEIQKAFGKDSFNPDTLDIDIDSSQYQKLADILGISKDLLVSMFDNARQFGGISFVNTSKLEASMRKSAQYAESIENPKKGYYSMQQFVKDGKEAGLTLQEIHKEAEILEEHGQITLIDFEEPEQALEYLKDIEGIFNEKDKTFDFSNLVTQMLQMGATTEQIKKAWSEITNGGKNKDLFTTEGKVDKTLNTEAGAEKKIQELSTEWNQNLDPATNALNEGNKKLDVISNKMDRLIVAAGGIPESGIKQNVDAADKSLTALEKNPKSQEAESNFQSQLSIIEARKAEFEELSKQPGLSQEQKDKFQTEIQNMSDEIDRLNQKHIDIQVKAVIPNVDSFEEVQDMLDLTTNETDIVKKAIIEWKENGDGEKFEEIIEDLPEEKRTILKAILSRKDQKNVKWIDDKLYEVDGNEATCVFSANADDVGEKFVYANGRLTKLSETSSVSNIKGDNTNLKKNVRDALERLGWIPKEKTVSLWVDIKAKAKDLWQKFKDKITGNSAHGTHGRRRGKNPVYGSAANGLNWQSMKPRASKYESGQTLVGELGQELIWSSRKGYAYLAGQYSPEVVNLDKGDVVYPADETKRILSGRSIHPTFGSMAHGRVDIPKSEEEKKKNKGKGKGKGSGSTGKGGKGGTTKKGKSKASAYEKDKAALDHLLEMRYISEKTYYARLKKLYKKYLKNRKGVLKEIRQSLEDQKKAWIDAYNYEKSLLDHKLTMGQITEKQYYAAMDKLGKKYYRNRKGYGDQWRQHQEEMLSYSKNVFDKEQAALDKKLEQGKISLNKYYEESFKIRQKWLSKKGLKDERNQAAEEAYDKYVDGVEKYLDDRQQEMDDKDLFDGWDSEDQKLQYLKETQAYLTNLYKNGHLKAEDYQRLWMETERDIKQTQDEIYSREQDKLNDIQDIVEDMIRQEAQDRIDALEKSADQYQEIINKKKESLELTRKELSFQEDMADLATQIAKKQAQVDMLARDTSRAGKAKYNQALEELNELIKQQDQAIREETTSQTQDNLDKQVEKYNELVQKQVDKIQEWLDNQKAVLDEVFKQIDNRKTNDLLDRLLEYNKKHGDGLEETVQDYWKDLSGLIGKYGDDVASIAKILRQKNKDTNTGGKVPSAPTSKGKGNKGKGGKGGKSGKSVVTKHTGLRTGFVGDNPTIKQNERFALLTNDELVLNTADQKRLSEQIKISDALVKAYTAASPLSSEPKNLNNTSNVELVNNTNINIEGSVDKDVMKKLESYGDMISDKTLNRIGEALNIKGVSPSQRINVYRR